MSGFTGTAPSATALRAFTAPTKIKRAWVAHTGDAIGIASLKINVAQSLPAVTPGRMFRTVGGFSLVNTGGGLTDLLVTVQLQSALYGTTTIFQNSQTLPISLAEKQCYAQMDVARYQDADTGETNFLCTGWYSFTLLASALPWWYPVALPNSEADTLTFRMFAQVITADAVLTVKSLGPTGTPSDLPEGTTVFLNTPVNAPVT